MRLMIMGDLHFPDFKEERSEAWKEAREEFYNTYLMRFFEVEADLYISLGDLTNFGSSDELLYLYRHIRQSGKHFRHVLGNHDSYSMPKAEITALTGQSRYHSIETDEVILVFLDTAKEMDFQSWGGNIDESQLMWLENLIEKSGSKPMFVFAHHPVYNTTARSERENLSIGRHIDMEKILNKKSGIGVYFCGHNHCHSIVNRGRWWYVQTASVLDHPAFRIAELSGDQLSITLVSLDDESLIRNALTIHEEMKHFTPNSDHMGEESDHNVFIALYEPSVG